MSALSIQPTYPIFTETDGQPLENGYIWIGTANLDPQANPISVYWDAALTQLAGQPIRTQGGYPVNNGTPARLYVNSDYSIRVMNKNGSVVYSAPAATERYSDVVVDGISANEVTFTGFKGQVGTVADLADNDGSDWIGFDPVGVGAVARSVQDKLREFAVSVKDYGAVGDGVTDDRAAINLAFDEVIGRGSGTVYFPAGTYLTSDLIGNTNYAGVTQEIRIAVEGEPGAIINCNPSVYANTALYLRFQDAKQILVKNLYVKCNTKVASGISATSAAFAEQIIIDNCTVDDCHAVNNAGVTTSVLPIYAASDAWGYLASVTNCIVRNVTRAKTGLACQGIGVVGFAAMTVANNTVTNVRHSGVVGDKQDADGIVVFSQQNGSGNYQKSAINVVNNHIRDCEGRFIKLQTNGSALVQGNYMSLDGSLELIQNFVGVDSQVGDADICDNTARIGTGWTGGASAIMFQPQPPLLANQDYSNEGFFQRVNRNNVEVRQQMPYFCVPGMPAAGVTANHYVEVADNFVNYPLSRAAASANSAFSHFIYLSNGPTPANTNGTVTWKINGNQVTTYNFISLTYTLGDYTDKWFMFVYDNYKASFGGDTRLVFAGDPYTNSCMIRDNQMGPGPGRIDWPLDLSKIYDGNDFYVGGQTLTNAPVGYSFSRVYKKGGVLGVQRSTQYYISSNTGAVWTALV